MVPRPARSIESTRPRTTSRPSRGLRLAVGALFFASCTPPPALPPKPLPPPAIAPPAATAEASATFEPVRPTPPAEPTEPRSPVLDSDRMQGLLQDAYSALVEGRREDAIASFRSAVSVAEVAGYHATMGLGDVQGKVLPARGGLSALDLGDDAWGALLFFRADTGEPFWFEPSWSSPEEEPVLPASALFRHQTSQSDAFFDPKLRKWVLSASRLLLTPGGRTAYSFADDDCRWHAFDLKLRRETAQLGKALKSGEPCDHRGHDSAFLAPGGALLVDGSGYWNLESRKFTSLVGPGKNEYAVSGSPDHRYVAYVADTGPISAETMAEAHRIVLVDLTNGKKTYTARTLPYLSNGDPLTFGRDPQRICVFDYGQWAFAVPSMTLLAHFPRDQRFRRVKTRDAAGRLVEEMEEITSNEDPEKAAAREALERKLLDCNLRVSKPLTPSKRGEDPGLRHRLAGRVCNIAGRLVPRAACEPEEAEAPRGPPAKKR